MQMVCSPVSGGSIIFSNTVFTGKSNANKDIYHRITKIDKSNYLTPLSYVLTYRRSLKHSEKIYISIAETLLDAGANVNEYKDAPDGLGLPLLSYCAQYESAAMVRLLLKHGASTEKRSFEGWLPIDYATIRQNKAILEVFEEFQSSKMIPYWDTSTDPTEDVFQSLLQPSSTALVAFGHAPLALLIGRKSNFRRRY